MPAFNRSSSVSVKILISLLIMPSMVGNPAEKRDSWLVFNFLIIPSVPPSTTEHAQDEYQQNCSDESYQDRLPVDTRHWITDMEEIGSSPASQHAAEHADNDVTY